MTPSVTPANLAGRIYARVTGESWSTAPESTRRLYRRIASAAREELAAEQAVERDRTRETIVGQLSPAQRAVLPHLLEGSPTAEIGERLGRSRHTVRNHTRAIFTRLGVTTRAGLVAKCAAAGVLADAAQAQAVP